MLDLQISVARLGIGTTKSASNAQLDGYLLMEPVLVLMIIVLGTMMMAHVLLVTVDIY